MGGVNTKGVRGGRDYIDLTDLMDMDEFPRDSRLMH